MIGDKDEERYERLYDEYSAEEYTGKSCKKCGRYRVLKCNNGKHICEKCAYDQNENSFSDEYREISYI